MADQIHKAQAFRALHVPGNPLVLVNAWDVGSTRAVEAAGAKAIATASWAVSAANGFADGEKLPLALYAETAERIATATDLPVSMDLESGYGADPAAVGASVARVLKAGVIGFNLEDSFPETGELRDTADQVARLKAARAAADAAGIPAFLNARTDIFIRRAGQPHDMGMVEAALERARAYADCGADGLFVPALVDDSLLAQLVEKSPLPVNIMAGADLARPKRAAELGVARVSYGPTAYRMAMALVETTAREVFGG